MIKTGHGRRGDRGVPREAGGPAWPGGLARGVVRLDGQLRLHARRPRRGAGARTPPTPSRATTWAATSSPCSSTQGRAAVYDFKRNEVPGSTERDRDYWRDVGTIDSYHEAHLDLVSALPIFNLYNNRLADLHRQHPAARREVRRRRASVRDSIVAPVRSSPAPPSTLGHRRATSRSRDGAYVQRSRAARQGQHRAGAVVRNVIIDKNVVIPDGALIGVDHDEDRRRGFTRQRRRRDRPRQEPDRQALTRRPPARRGPAGGGAPLLTGRRWCGERVDPADARGAPGGRLGSPDAGRGHREAPGRAGARRLAGRGGPRPGSSVPDERHLGGRDDRRPRRPHQPGGAAAPARPTTWPPCWPRSTRSSRRRRRTCCSARGPPPT